jgi:hypothetical protein
MTTLLAGIKRIKIKVGIGKRRLLLRDKMNICRTEVLRLKARKPAQKRCSRRRLDWE